MTHRLVSVDWLAVVSSSWFASEKRNCSLHHCSHRTNNPLSQAEIFNESACNNSVVHLPNKETTSVWNFMGRCYSTEDEMGVTWQCHIILQPRTVMSVCVNLCKTSLSVMLYCLNSSDHGQLIIWPRQSHRILCDSILTSGHRRIGKITWDNFY